MRSFNRLRSAAAAHQQQTASVAAAAMAFGTVRCQSSSSSAAGGSSGWDNNTASSSSWGSDSGSGGGWGSHAAASSEGNGGGWGGSASSSASGGGGRWGASASGSGGGGWASHADAAPSAAASSSWGNFDSNANNAAASNSPSSSSYYNDEEEAFMRMELSNSNSGSTGTTTAGSRNTTAPSSSSSTAAAENIMDDDVSQTGEESFFDEEEDDFASHGGPCTTSEGAVPLPTDSTILKGAQRDVANSKRIFESQSLKNNSSKNGYGGVSAFGNEAARAQAEVARDADLDEEDLFIAGGDRRAAAGAPSADASGAAGEVVESVAPVVGKQTSLGPMKDGTLRTPIAIDIAARYEPRLASLPNATVDGILALQPRDAVHFASEYVKMQNFIRNCRRKNVRFVNAIFLTNLKEEALMSAAISAIEKKSVPIEHAVKILHAPFMFERLVKYRRYLATLMRAWTIEVILSNSLTPLGARKLLTITKHFGRDARVIGSLSQKAVEDLETLDTASIIRIMYSIAETHVKPPASYWTNLLRQVTKNMHTAKANGNVETAGVGTAVDGATSSDAVSPSVSSPATVDTDGPKPRNVMTPLDAYRILDCCARVGVFSDVNMLAQISEYGWKEIANRAAKANFPEVPMLKARAALRRLNIVSGLVPNQFFRFIQITSTLGTNFTAGRGVITDQVLVPLTFHLNDHHLSELIEALSISKTRYAPAIQAVIDRVVVKGSSSPTALMHASRILRSIAQHNDVCAQLRLAKFFDLLEEVCSQKQTLRTIQMTRIVEDIYFITRRFARTAPIVVRMQKLVEEFCGSLCLAVRRGVVAIDQVNTVLEHTVMMGMSKDGERFPNTRRLREMRKELYQHTRAGAFPTGYKDRIDPSVRFLYNDLIYVNQSQSLFMQQVDRGALAQLQQLIAAAGPLNMLRAVMIYNELHGTSLPLSPFIQQLLYKHMRHVVGDVKTGDDIAIISKKMGYPYKRLMTEKDLALFAAAIGHKSINGLKRASWYLEFLDASAVALGGNEDLQAKIHALQKYVLK